MPKTRVVFYAEENVSPVLEWLDEIADNARDKLFYRIRRLEEAGHELRRPEADYLRDAIYELRVRHQRINYRLLYFFHKGLAVVAHGCTKEGAVDDRDVERAITRRRIYVSDPQRHSYAGPAED
jgi:hypothetical protein